MILKTDIHLTDQIQDQTKYNLVYDLLSGILHTTHICWNAKTFTVGQGEKFVVVQHRVQVLHPLWVHVTIKDDPLSLGQFSTYIVNDSAQYTLVHYQQG